MDIEEFLRAEAIARGMDPDIVVKAAKSEGGLSDPFQQSFVTKNGVREPSYGPLQLLVGGPGTGFPAGLGNEALSRGIDPRKDWQNATRFALDTVAKDGWRQWYGPRKVGIGRWDGVRGSKPLGVTLNSAPNAAPPLNPPREVKDYPVAEANSAAPSLDGLKSIIDKLEDSDSKAGKGFTSMLSAFGGGGSGGSSTPQIQPSAIGQAVSSEIASKSASAQALMSQILQSRRGKRQQRVLPGISLMG